MRVLSVLYQNCQSLGGWVQLWPPGSLKTKLSRSLEKCEIQGAGGRGRLKRERKGREQEERIDFIFLKSSVGCPTFISRSYG